MHAHVHAHAHAVYAAHVYAEYKHTCARACARASTRMQSTDTRNTHARARIVRVCERDMLAGVCTSVFGYVFLCASNLVLACGYVVVSAHVCSSEHSYLDGRRDTIHAKHCADRHACTRERVQK